MELHLDPIGGISGDMFIAALLDAFPDLQAGVIESIRRVAADRVTGRLQRHGDAAMQGARFTVEAAPRPGRHHGDWTAIRESIARSDLAAEVKGHAIGIFAHLAAAEGRVHGVAAEAVTFHELGAADSIADIVGAAHIIAALGAARWSVGPLPLGSGRIAAAHGTLPVPAPATLLLLEGFATIDDGIAGERITPTGAAILRHLGCRGAVLGEPRLLARSGIGFGTRSFPGISNCLRVLVFETAPDAFQHREIAVIEFEVDDQSGEDLALALDRLRALPGVLDGLQIPAFGKKGRLTAHIQILAAATERDAVIAACFRETTTIGLRHRLASGALLPRRMERVEIAGRRLRVKAVTRPGGHTAKAEADDLADIPGQGERARLRQAAEARALAAELPE